MHKALNILSAAIMLAVMLSCSKQSLKSAWSTQEDRIDSFIQSIATEGGPDDLYMRDLVYNGGANRVVLKEGTGEGLANGGTVSFYYTGYVFQGSISPANIFATNDPDIAQEAGWEVTDATFEVKTVTLGGSDGLVEGLHKGLEGVKAGEICYILFSGQYGFGKRPVGIIPGNSALLYHIRVLSVSN